MLGYVWLCMCHSTLFSLHSFLAIVLYLMIHSTIILCCKQEYCKIFAVLMYMATYVVCTNLRKELCCTLLSLLLYQHNPFPYTMVQDNYNFWLAAQLHHHIVWSKSQPVTNLTKHHQLHNAKHHFLICTSHSLQDSAPANVCS